MARAQVKIVCAHCGKEFMHTKLNCYNRKDANNYEKWVERNIDTCPECSLEIMKEKKLASVKEFEKNFPLPALTGSEKQIAWAKNIRYNCLKNLDSDDMAFIKKIAIGFQESDLDMESVRKEGMTVKEITETYREIYKKKIIMLTSVSAKEIIENR